MRKIYSQILFIAISFVVSGQAFANETAKEFNEGSQYQRLDPPVPLTAPAPIQTDKVEVIEMFFYACPHCYELEPKLIKWASDKPWVDFKRVPAIVGPTWVDQARMYFIAEKLGILDKTHNALFKSIHDDGEQYYNEHTVMKFLTSQGADPEKVYELYHSDEITRKVSDARVLTTKYKLRGVPAVAVNGKYVTAPYFVRSQEEMIEVLDYLVEQERKKTQAKKNSNEVTAKIKQEMKNE